MKQDLNNLSKENDITTNIKKINSLFDALFETDSTVCTLISNKFNIPKKEASFFFKKTSLNLINFSNEKIFINKFNLLGIIKYFFLSILHCLYLLIFNKKKKENRSFKLLLDHIDSEHELKHYLRIIEKFNSKDVLIRTRNKNLKYKNQNIIFFKRYKNYNFYFSDFFNYFKLIIISFILSLKSGVNYNFLVLKIIDEIFFYKSFFNKFKIDFILMHQHYYSSNIKNYFFKKNGGKLSCLIQKNLNTKNTNGYYYDCDTLFTYSTNAAIRPKESNSNIKNIYPVGSIFMERHFYNEKEVNVPKLDILYIAGTGLYPGNYYDTYNSYKLDYDEHLNWLIKISNDFPKITVGIKHRFNNKNSYEYDFLKNSKVIIVDQNLNSYHVADKANFLCSWCSSMIVELNSIGKQGVFLDPGSRNDQFLSDLNFRENISATSYDEFKKIVSLINNKNHLIENSKFYCLNSDDVSQKISNYLLIQK